MPISTATSTFILEIDDVHKTYGKTTALSGIDLVMKPGEWLGMLGPNGAGKTTLVKAIAGRVKLDSGNITLFGNPLDQSKQAAALRTKLGVVPQEIALYPKLTARENLEVFGTLNGLARSQATERIDWALEFTGLADRANELLGTFSGGMKRRLNIACSVLHRPELILLDEPTVGVDPQSRERIWEMLRQLNNDGATLVLTSHQLNEVEQVCQRIVIIDHGKVIARGSFDELIEQTIGSGRQITFVLDQPLQKLPTQDNEPVFEQTADDRRVSAVVQNVASELPLLLEIISRSEAQVVDLHMQAPTLQSVFIHLTGRELRE